MMTYLYGGVLVLTAAFELLAAVSLVGGPGGIQAAGSGDQWSMHYGFAALVMASVPVWAWRNRFLPAVATQTLGILMMFHLLLMISLSLAGDQPAGMVIHGVLGSLCVALFALRSRLFDHAGEAA